MPLGVASAFFAAEFARTRSAHDFGIVLAGDTGAPDVDVSVASGFALTVAAMRTVFSSPLVSLSSASRAGTVFDFGTAICGIAGMTGVAIFGAAVLGFCACWSAGAVLALAAVSLRAASPAACAVWTFCSDSCVPFDI